jgi:hypothetical protein
MHRPYEKRAGSAQLSNEGSSAAKQEIKNYG